MILNLFRRSSTWENTFRGDFSAAEEAIKAGDALFGTIDPWLIWNLTGGLVDSYAGRGKQREDMVQGRVSFSEEIVHSSHGLLSTLAYKLRRLYCIGRSVFVLVFKGLFAPSWSDDARGVVDVLDSMHRDFIKGSEGKSKGEFLLRVDEGAAVNDLLMQMQVIVEVISMILGLS
ncbi:hypothetical protein HPP92_009999 [Vanilla planifolia]|uniref:Uncharacterized protein n=1 Tax=Vanilla planifolia TaxID=51239 RepID=A0A835V6U9_VANPL|nr:hypothetical protein HPP92_009999 [Vanilla planifolia]